MQYFGRYILVLCLVVSFSVFAGTKQSRQVIKRLPLDGIPGVVLKNSSNSLYLPGCVIVKLMPQARTSLSKSAFGIAAIDRVLSRVMGISTAQLFPAAPLAQKPGDVDLSMVYVVSYSSPNEPFAIAEELSQLAEVQYAEPWFIYRITERTSTPNDPYFTFQWALKQVNASAAWDITQGDSTVVVAVVDSGVESDHPDLAANIWVNSGEMGLDAFKNDKRSNGVDDDGNGYVDDWHGWDLVGDKLETYNPTTTKGDNDPSPKGVNNGHGTIVGGIIAAVSNNGIGVASLAPKCRILPVKVSADDDTRSGGDAYILAGYPGIVYAATMGAKIINCSWGGAGASQAEQDVIDFATQHGALVVASAGNNDPPGTFSTPASYRNVLSVASTGTTDHISTFSDTGENVDVSAPGEAIYSTQFPHTYSMSNYGTSFSSPMTAAVAALVKTKFPNYTPVQVGEQVRVTSDNIDALNPTYVGQMGYGRINALRALTVTNLPSVRLHSFAVKDFPGGNGNGVAEPAETLSVVCTFRNFLSPTSSGANVQLTSTDTRYITVLQGSFSLASLGTLDSVSNKAAPFRIYVQKNVPQSYTARLQLTYRDGSFTDAQYVSFFVNPTYATHNVNAIQLTLTNNGRIGFYDFPDNLLGRGFIFNDANFLFEGGLIVGTSSIQVDDVVRNPAGTQNRDFKSSSFYTFLPTGIVSDQDGMTTFNDSLADANNKIGLLVDMRSYAFSDPGDSKFILLQYNIKNNTRNSLTNLYAGLFLDWDIGNYDFNISSYDAARSLGYAYDAGTGSSTRREYLGVVALDGAAGFRTLVRDSADLTKPSKWDWISGGFKRTQAGPIDIHQVISSGPYTLGPGITRTVAFALVAGDSSLANIQQSADAARARWKMIATTVGIGDNAAASPVTYQLAQNYPNPFNPSTNFEFRIANRELVTLKVFDVLGREIITLVNEERPAGIYRVTWDASKLPSGVYFYRLRAGDFLETKKMVFAK